MSTSRITLPSRGRPHAEIIAEMNQLREHDVRWQEGRVWSLVFSAGDEVGELLKDAYTLFFSENGLNPTAFPSLRAFETEVLATTADLLGGDEQVIGNMTSGGTESILMAVKTARDWARATRRRVRRPEIVLPSTAHPAFDKAAHYFDVTPIRVPVGQDFRANIAATRKAINKRTILIVGSAPSYPHGVIDPIAELAQLAGKAGILCHVDACVGGFFLPFMRRLGYAVPPFDFSVPGVSSISVDLHKYGYAAKGASAILYRNHALHRHQLFAATDWPGGIYASPTMTGTRPGGAIAAAWAVMQFLGESGYLDLARRVMQATAEIRRGITAIDGLTILGDPAMSILAIASSQLDIYEVGDEMTLRGWHLDRQQFPPSLHLTVNAAHTGSVDAFLQDLADSVEVARQRSGGKTGMKFALALAGLIVRVLPGPIVSALTRRVAAGFNTSAVGPGQRSAAMYGIIGSLPNRGDLRELVLDLVEQFTVPQPQTNPADHERS